MSDENFDYGYGDFDDVAKQTSSGGKYLKIQDDHEYMLRIASTPRYVLRHWIDGRTKVVPCGGDACEFCGKDVKPSDRLPKDAQWGWIVIDREDNNVKILQGPNSVARALKDLSSIINKRTNKPTWGDPRSFDITLKRQKKSNGFYEYIINPDPDSRGELTEEEKKLVADSGIDLEASMKASKKSDNLGNYGGGKARDLETAPDEDVNPDDIPDDLGEKKDPAVKSEDGMPF